MKTKIVCTLGPATASYEAIENLMVQGMDVARLNFSHGDHKFHSQMVEWIRKAASKLNKTVAILQDLQGPKIRVGRITPRQLVKDQVVRIVYGLEDQSPELPVDYKPLHEIKVGQRILLDDGLIAMEVITAEPHFLEAKVTMPGTITSRKGVNFPESQLSIPAMTEKDIQDVIFGVTLKLDFVALSFVRLGSDIQELRTLLDSLNSKPQIVSKIEMLKAMDNLDEICEHSDAIMVARGDLGVECGFPLVAPFQKRIVDVARAHGKPVIMATQMMESMRDALIPTQAEIADITHAVTLECDATMLSAESASGKYPGESVQTMRKILDLAQSTFLKENSIQKASQSSFASAAIHLAEDIKASAFITLDEHHALPYHLAYQRPSLPIYALCDSKEWERKFCLVKGVIPLSYTNQDQSTDSVSHHLKALGHLKSGDKVVILSHHSAQNMSVHYVA